MKFPPILVILLAISILTGCDRELEEADGGKVNVVTTTYPLTFIAERIGGERISIVQIVKPGVEAHDFEPAPSDVIQIKESDIFIYNHPSLEGWSSGLIDRSNISADSNTIWVQTIQLEESDKEHSVINHEGFLNFDNAYIAIPPITWTINFYDNQIRGRGIVIPSHEYRRHHHRHLLQGANAFRVALNVRSSYHGGTLIGIQFHSRLQAPDTLA